MISDAVIKDIAGKGSLKAFETLFSRYYIKVRNFAAGMIKDREEAENIAQNVFMKLWLARHALSEEQSLDSYIFTIARNEVCDYFRDKSYNACYVDAVRKTDRKIDYDIESEFDINEIRRIVDDTVAHMPEQRRMIFRMSRIQHMTNEEIAVRLGISKRTVEKHISLALKSIRKHLGDFLFWVFIFFIS